MNSLARKNTSLLAILWAGGLFLAITSLLAGCGNESLIRKYDSDEEVLYSPTTRIQGFDPVKSGDVASSMAIARVYEGLLQYSYLRRPYAVEPLLASAMPEISEDQLTYTFEIRKGIFFQDDPCFTKSDGRGRELTAADFVYSIKRVADVKNASPGYWAFNNRIRGLDEFHEVSVAESATDYDMPVAGLKALDRHTLQIKLKEPYPQLLWVLAMHYAFAVPHEAVEYYGDDFVNHPVGTGPYLLQDWQRNYRVEFARNPKWRETDRQEFYPTVGTPEDRAKGLLNDAGKQIPFIDRIVQFVVSDGTTQWMMFLSGQFSQSGISRDNWDAIMTPGKELSQSLVERGINLLAHPTLDLFYIGFNMDDKVVGSSDDPLEDERHKKLRQAISCAFDHDRWVQFYNNRIAPVYGPIPDPLAGFQKEPGSYAFDLNKARKLMQEAGYPEGIDPESERRLELTLELGSADPQTRQSVALFSDMMNKIGIVIKPSYNNWPTFLDKMNRRQAQLFRLGWVADYPDAENFLQLFYGPNESPGPNHANYQNEEFDSLYEKARTMQLSPERTKLYKQMASIVVEDSPWVFMHQPMSYMLNHGWVRNFKPHDFPYGMTKYYRLDTDQRDKWLDRYGEERMGIDGGVKEGD